MLTPTEPKPRLQNNKVSLRNPYGLSHSMCLEVHILRGVGSYYDNVVGMVLIAVLSCEMYGDA